MKCKHLKALDQASRLKCIEQAARALLEAHDGREQHPPDSSGHDEWLLACSQARRALRAALKPLGDCGPEAMTP